MDTQMESKELVVRCGLSLKPVKREPRWVNVTLHFVGGGDYILASRITEAKLETRNGGFGLDFRHRIGVPTEALLGKKVRTGTLYDVRVVFDAEHALPELSLASLIPGRYPRVLRAGEVVRLN